MSYFNSFPLVKYKFGNEDTSVFFQNISVYIDLIDNLIDNVAFYNSYEIIDGDRPDTLSYKLYGTSDYYWTFFLLNKKLRESGWPIPNSEIEKFIQDAYPNYVIRLDNITVNGVDESTLPASEQKYFGIRFVPGEIVNTNNQDVKLEILTRNLSLGSFTVKPTTEVSEEIVLALTSINGTNGLQQTDINYKAYSSNINAISKEHEAVHSYSRDNEPYDINPFNFSETPVDVSALSNEDRLMMMNDKLKTIRILKPQSIENIVSEFNRLIRS